MSTLYRICEWGVVAKNRLPPGLKSFLVDAFFCYVPIPLLRMFWKELAGYTLLRRPRRGEVVVDAGAWTGHFTVVAARLVGRRGRVLAIEPQKAAYERLEERLRRLKLKNVTVVNAALFDRSGSVSVVKTDSPAFTVFEEAKDSAHSEVARLRTLDEIVATLGLKAIDFVKMDIEGAELEALAGAGAMMDSMHPFFAIASYHEREGATTSARVEQILKTHDYLARTGHPWHLTTWGWWRKTPVGVA